MFLLILAAFLFGLVSSIFQALVATYLWAWFIVPTFNLPPLGLVTAMGISLLISLLFKSRPEAEDGDVVEALERSVTRVTVSIIHSCMALALGYIFQQFI